MANTQFTGVVTIRIDGKSMRSKPGAKLKQGGFRRTPVFGDGVFLGYKNTPVESRVTFEVEHSSDSDLDMIGNATDVTIGFECDSGVNYVVRNSACAEPPELTGGDNSGIACDFFGAKAVKQ
jgi:Phage tail tube protein